MLLILATYFGIAWISQWIPLAPVWGDYATWASAVATAGGLIFAARSISHQTNQLKAQEKAKITQATAEKYARARMIGQDIVYREHTYTSMKTKTSVRTFDVSGEVQNNSPYPINHAWIRVWNVDPEPGTPDDYPQLFTKPTRETMPMRGEERTVDFEIGTVLPGRPYAVEHPNYKGEALRLNPSLVPEEAEKYDAVLWFTDAWNDDWCLWKGKVYEMAPPSTSGTGAR